MRRQREVTVASDLPPERVAALLDLRGRESRRVRLWARVTDGGVKARVPARSQYDTNPVLHGVLQRTPGGSVLRGTVREARTAPFVQWSMLAPGVLMLLLAVALLTARPVDLAGLVVCGTGGAALLSIGLGLRRMRDTSFAVDCDELEHALRSRLRR